MLLSYRPRYLSKALNLGVFIRVRTSFIRFLNRVNDPTNKECCNSKDYEKWGWSPGAIYKVLLAENTGGKCPKYLGFALYYFTYSTWTGHPTLWLEDLFVPEELRGNGIGSTLLRKLARIALDKGCARMEWTVLDWNEPSRKFYYGLGAKSMDEWTTFRLTQTEIRKLAEN